MKYTLRNWCFFSFLSLISSSLCAQGPVVRMTPGFHAFSAVPDSPDTVQNGETNPQTGQIRGSVVSTDQKPATSVNLQIRELNRTVSTDEEGNFEFPRVPPGDYTLIISHAGLQSQEQKVRVETGRTLVLSITLKETARQLDAIVVTSRRTVNERTVSFGKAGLRPLDMPQSAGIVTHTVIADQQASRVGDVIKNVSGVSLTQQRQGVAETFSARGYSIGMGGAGGSIFKNGVMINTMGIPEASTLESIEVLKGSSALLYGNTSGGVIINMVTKKPKFNFGGEASMRYGSNNLYKPILDLYGPLSDKLAFRVTGTYENADSYRDVVRTRRTYVNPSLLYRAGKKTTIYVTGDYLAARLTPDYGIGILNDKMEAIIPASRSRFINTSWAWYNVDQSSGNVTVDHAFSDSWKLNFIMAAQHTQVNAFGTGAPNAIAANGNYARSLSRTRSSEDDYTGQLNLNGRFKTGLFSHQLLVGTDYVGVITKSYGQRITRNNGVIGSAYDTINILDPGRYTPRTDIPFTQDTSLTRTPSFRLGYYAQDLISITDKFKVLAGLRWSYLQSSPVVTNNYVKQTETRTAISDYRIWSPKLAFIYQPVTTTSVYITYANNFTANTGTDINGKPLDPSLIDQYELGVKNIFLEGRLSANFSLYRIQNNNLAQVAIYKADGSLNTDPNVKELTGQTISDGLEVDLNGALSENIYFIAGYGYNNARYSRSTGKTGSVITGEPLINNPKHTANATLFYTFTASWLKGVKLGVTAFYTGDRMGGNQNTVGQTPAYNRLVPLSAFTTVDLSAGYTIRRISVLARLSNIANTLNYAGHERYSINPIPPRQFTTTLTYKF